MLIDHPLDQPLEARRAAILAAIPHVGADAAQAYMLVRGNDRIVRFHGIRGASAVRPAEERWRSAEGLAFLLTELDPDHVAPLDELGAAPDDVYRSPLWRYAFTAFGYERALYMNVTAHGEIRGHVCFLTQSKGPWDVPTPVRRAVAATVAAAFRTSWEAELALAPPTNASVTLLANGGFVADDATTVWMRRNDAGPWLRDLAEHGAPTLRTGLGRSERAWAPASFVSLHPIPGGGTLVNFEPTRAMKLPPVLSQLTPTQLRIATLAAAGATAGEIGRLLVRSPETVREHLTRIYERLGVGSRTELVTICRSIFV